jgi:hypothetical protein
MGAGAKADALQIVAAARATALNLAMVEGLMVDAVSIASSLARLNQLEAKREQSLSVLLRKKIHFLNSPNELFQKSTRK